MTPHQARNDVVRTRVRDAVMDMGHGDLEAGIERFVDHAIWVGEQHELRLWEGDKHMRRRSARHSLKTILGLNVGYARPNWKEPKNNLGWVLSVWEAAVDDWFRVSPPKQVEECNANGTVPLSTRILEAYLARNADVMLAALGELEAKGL